MEMDPTALEAIDENDGRSGLVSQQQQRQIYAETILHKASISGDIGRAKTIANLKPEMVLAKNGRGDTPLHEACRAGHANMVLFLLEITRSAAYVLNSDEETPFCIACEMGHDDIVQLMLGNRLLENIEKLGYPLHESVIHNHTNTVRIILAARPELALKVDKEKYLPMHYACLKGNLEMITILMQCSERSFMKFNKNGYTPFHLAVMNGKVDILKKIISSTTTTTITHAFHQTTKFGETVFHLAVKSCKYEAFVWLPRFSKNKDLLLAQDGFGETILHLAVSNRSSYRIADYLIKEQVVPVNAEDGYGLTALDKFQIFGSIHTKEEQALASLFFKADGKNGSGKISVSPPGATSIPERKDNDHMKDMHVEALQNATKTIIVVAVLISTQTFGAGISPPGGVYTSGPMEGKAMAARTKAYNFFQISNVIALFTSIMVVVNLVRIIAFRRTPLLQLLTIVDKVMLVALIFSGTSYVAATMVTTPNSHLTELMSLCTLIVAISTLVITLVIIATLMIFQWQRKKKWMNERPEGVQIDENKPSDQAYIQANLESGYYVI